MNQTTARWALGLGVAAAILPVASQAAPVVNYEVIHKLNGEEGFAPSGALVAGPGGKLYGTTAFGAAYSRGASFKSSTSGKLKTLYAFGAPGTPQARPSGGLTLAGDGNFYGGARGDSGQHDVVYRMTPQGETTTLFDLNTSSCRAPAGKLALAQDGRLYGMTYFGGANDRGCIYSVGTDGVFTLLHSMAAADGAGDSYSRLVVSSDGYLYGTSPYGGAHDGGTLFRVSTTGEFEVIHAFASPGSSEAAEPTKGLVEGPDGMLYGSAYRGGAQDLGVIYRIAKDGSQLSVILDYAEFGRGLRPAGELALGSDGQLYGAAFKGGIRGLGQYFRVTLDGQYTKLHQADRDLKESSALIGQMVELAPGEFYGLTETGGKYTQGTLFKLQVQ